MGSCYRGPVEDESANLNKPAETPKPQLDPSLIERIKIKTPGDVTVAQFKIKGGDCRVEFTSDGQEKVLHILLKEGGRKRVKMAGSGAIAEIIPTPGGFTLNDEDGDALWQVQFTDDKVTIINDDIQSEVYTLEIRNGEIINIQSNIETRIKLESHVIQGQLAFIVHFHFKTVYSEGKLITADIEIEQSFGRLLN